MSATVMVACGRMSCQRERDVGYSNGSVWPHVVCEREREMSATVMVACGRMLCV